VSPFTLAAGLAELPRPAGAQAIYLFTFVPISRLGAIGPYWHAGGCPASVEYPVPAGKCNNFNG
jgi:hypothetical protein